jgi:hypothetical protein
MAERLERRLATILAADVCRLMRADEDGTRVTLTACRAIVDRLIATNAGESPTRLGTRSWQGI